MNFTFKLDLCFGHLKVTLKTCDLNLEGQIGLSNLQTICFNIDLFGILPLHLNLSQIGLKTGDFDLDLKGQICLELLNVCNSLRL